MVELPRLVLLALLALVATPGSVPAYELSDCLALGEFPWVSDEVDIAGGSRASSIPPNPEISPLVRIEDSMYSIYRGPDNKVWVREFNAGDRFATPSAAGAPVPVFDDPRVFNGNSNDYHQEPSIFRDSSGRLIPVVGMSFGRQFLHGLLRNEARKPGSRFPVLQRAIDRSSLANGAPPACTELDCAPNGWTRAEGLSVRPGVEEWGVYCDANDYPGEDPTAFPRIPDAALASFTGYACGAYLSDLAGPFDPRARVTHMTGEISKPGVVDGVLTAGGLGRAYYRILSDGTFDGPYVLVDAPNMKPDAQANGGLAGDRTGNIFTKGDIVLGKEPSGQRSLHIAWNIRHTYRHRLDETRLPRGPFCTPDTPYDVLVGGSIETQVSAPDCNDPGAGWLADPDYNPMADFQNNYDLYYARSLDGGHTWTNAAGDACHIQASAPDYETNTTCTPGPIDHDDPRFLVLGGELGQGGGERGISTYWDSSAQRSVPVIVATRYDLTSGAGTKFGHVSQPPTLSSDGQAWALDWDPNWPDDWPQPLYRYVYARHDGASWQVEDFDDGRSVVKGAGLYNPHVDARGWLWIFMTRNTQPIEYTHFDAAQGPPASGVVWERLPNLDPGAESAFRGQLITDPEDPNFVTLSYWRQLPGVNPVEYQFFMRRLQLTDIPLTSLPSLGGWGLVVTIAALCASSALILRSRRGSQCTSASNLRTRRSTKSVSRTSSVNRAAAITTRQRSASSRDRPVSSK